MKIRLYSDLHLDIHNDRGKDWLAKSADAGNIDVLVLAGDITCSLLLDMVFNTFCNKYPHVIYVLGNHERYGLISHKETQKEIDNARKKYSNLHILDNDFCTINGQRFVGSTLWFEKIPQKVSILLASQHLVWSDFREIAGGETWIYSQNEFSKKYLNKTVRADDVVITHYLPSYNCVAQRWLGDPNNCFFVCDMHDLIVNKNPKLWLFGHTHSAMKLKIERTSLCANPLGYITYGERSEFDHENLIDI
jgi:predicted phosphodiesterase